MYPSASPALPSLESSPVPPDSYPVNTVVRDAPTKSTTNSDMCTEHHSPGSVTEKLHRLRNPVSLCSVNRAQTEEYCNTQMSAGSVGLLRMRPYVEPAQESDCRRSAGPYLFLFSHQINLPQAIVASYQPFLTMRYHFTFTNNP